MIKQNDLMGQSTPPVAPGTAPGMSQIPQGNGLWELITKLMMMMQQPRGGGRGVDPREP